MQPDFASPHAYLWYYYREAGDYPNAIAELKKWSQLRHDAAASAQADAASRGFAKSGAPGFWQSLFAEQLRQYRSNRTSPCFVADTAARMGGRSDALHFLNLCVQAHQDFALGLVTDPAWESYHHDSEFQQLVAKIGVVPPN